MKQKVKVYQVEVMGKTIGTAKKMVRKGDTGWLVEGFIPDPKLDLKDRDVDQILFNTKQGMAMTYCTKKGMTIREYFHLIEAMRSIPYKKYDDMRV